MSFIDDFRKILKRRIKQYRWDNIQAEIKSFFVAIQRANILDETQKCLKNFVITPKGIFDKFFLNEKRVMDIIYLDRIYEMLMYIKEINFCFPNNWDTHSYHHHNHGYRLKDLLLAIKLEVEELIHFKTDKFDLLVGNPQDFQVKEKFIDINFTDYDLIYYDPYVKLINGIAYHNDFYMTLPHLLRSLFENLLQDMFSQSLEIKCSDLYYNRRAKRINDFSKLIALLDQLKDEEFGPYISGKITKDTIKELENIREKGNISIHDIGDKITPDYANDIKDTIKITLNPLLIAYKKLKGKDVKVEGKRKHKIKLKLGLIKKDKKQDSQKEDQPDEPSNSEISVLLSEIRLLIDNNLADNILNIRIKMDDLIPKLKSLNLKNKQSIALRKAYIFFNANLLCEPPLKSILHTILDTINSIIL